MKNIILQSSPSEWKEALHECGIDLQMWQILLLFIIILVLGLVIKHYWCNWQEARSWRKNKMKAIAKRYNLSEEELRRMNPSVKTDLLKQQTKIRIK